MKTIVAAVLSAIFLQGIVFADANDLIPAQLEWEGRIYSLVPWEELGKGVVYTDINGDGVDEAVASFRASTPGEEYPVPQTFHLIYEFTEGKPKLVKTIVPLDEKLNEVKSVELPSKNGVRHRALAIFGHGGAHYTSLSVYKYINEDYELIFENGSACPVEVRDGEDSVSIWVGRANWDEEGWCYAIGEPLWQVYTWDGDAFIYNSELSTTREISEYEEVTGFVGEYKKRAEQQ